MPNVIRWRAGRLLAPVLLLSALETSAQPAAPPPNMALLGRDPAATAYEGPRYPGGPDSLRATIRRHLRQASPELKGTLFLHLELDSMGFSRAAYFLPPPAGSPAIALYLNPEVQGLAQQLVQLLRPWQLRYWVRSGIPHPATSVTLPLPFGPEPTPAALAYGDELPTFSVVPLPVLGHSKGTVPSSLAEFLGRQARYPPEDQLRRRQGTVFAYFEVSETGKLENQSIIGTVSPTLDAEVLRVLRRLPSALTPPRYQGRPARVFYVVPMSFWPY